MKRLLACCLLLAVLYCGCKPAKQDPTPVEDFKFSTEYNPIISVYPKNTTYFNFSVKVLQGDINKNKLTCSISDFPFGVSVIPQTIVIGQLLGGVYTIDVGDVKPGDYAMKVAVSSATTTTENHTVILRVLAPVDYAPLIAGSYDKSFDFCQPGPVMYYKSVVSTVVDSPYKITISNIKNLGPGAVIRATLSDIVTIPVQSMGVYTVWGSGIYSKDGRAGHENDYIMLINDTLANGTDTSRCTMHIEH